MLNKQTTQISYAGEPVAITEKGDVAVPATFEAHLFAKNPGPEFVLLTEVDEANARSLQLFNEMYLKFSTTTIQSRRESYQ